MQYFQSIALYLIAILICMNLITLVSSQALTGNDQPATSIGSIPLWEEFLRLLAAFGIGALIGLEREFTNVKRHLRGMAGMRTHGLISAGSCLIMLVSIYGFVEVVGHNNPRDPSRLAAQAVSGIGFIGAGSILKGGSTILGLTSAASLWLCMAIGLGLGAGYYVPTVIAAATCLFCMIVVKRFERAIFGNHRNIGAGFITQLTIVAIDKSKPTEDLVSCIDEVLSVSKLEIQRRPTFEVPKQLEASHDAEPISPNQHLNKEGPQFHPEKELSGIQIAESTVCPGNERSFSSAWSPHTNVHRPEFPLPVSVVNTIEYKIECYLNNCPRAAFGKRILGLAKKYSDSSDILVFKIGEVREIDESESGQFLHAEEKEKSEEAQKEVAQEKKPSTR